MACFCRFEGHSGRCLVVFFAQLGLGACGGPEPERGASEVIAPGQPEVELGARSENGYQALAEDASVPVIFGTQGGTWIMPVLRVRGIAAPMQVSGNLMLENGEVLGASDVAMSLDDREGWLESERFAVPVQHAPPRQFDSIADVYGRAATVTVQVTDDAGRFAEREVRVLLVEP